ncbi:MAG: ABC transporter ATP-binding protein [Burkholderiaceae bacterium]|jgi:NitT/TauT family transport system ATP-binding protein|nr:ABC transporter ATP-binding protein [Burkholderiaceae bacterium]
MSGAYIAATGVGKTYPTRSGPLHAVADATFEAEEGQFISLLGPSGCGKSTLLMMLAGLEGQSKGTLQLAGKPVSGPRRDTGIIFQDATLLPWRSVLDNVMFPIEILKLPRDAHLARAHELLARVGLKGFEEKRPHELSGGMRQRVAICRALVHDPKVLLMDEPFSALDAITRDQMNVVLSDMLERYRKTVIFVTHSIREAVYLSDRVLVMGGRPSSIILDLPVTFTRPRPFAIEDTAEFGALCRQLRETIEQAHASTGASALDTTRASAGATHG